MSYQACSGRVDSIADVPCFKCLLNKAVNPFFCQPENCKELESWLQEIMVVSFKLKSRKKPINTSRELETALVLGKA